MGVPPPTTGVPAITQFNEAWFTSGTLAIQQCTACGTRQHPPEEICHSCGGYSFRYEVLSPTGTVYSHTVVHYAASPSLGDAIPYTIVLVALDDDPAIRVVGNLDEPTDEVRIGLPVEAYWESRSANGRTVLIPQWRAVVR
jgi:uncharacterized OB-fold protein